MTSVDIVETYESGEWRDLILDLEGTPLHLPEVWTVGTDTSRLRYIVWRRKGTPVAATVAIVEEMHVLKFIKKGAALHLPVAPVSRDDSFTARQELYETLRESCAGHGYREMVVDSRWGERPEMAKCLRGTIEMPRLEFVVDLSLGEDELLRAMHKKHRKNIRLARDLGVEVADNVTQEAFLSLRHMQQSSSERSAERGNVYKIQGEEFYRESFDKIYKNGLGKVLFALKDGEIVAALAYLEFGKKSMTVRSGSTKIGYETSAMYLLQFDLFRRLASNGVLHLNIGGVPAESVEIEHPQHGLYNYKRYYGGTQCVCSGFALHMR